MLSRQSRTYLATSAFALAIGLALASLAFLYLNRNSTGVLDSFGFREIDPFLVFIFAATGYLLALRVSDNEVGWCLLASGLLIALNTIVQGVLIYTVYTEPGAIPAPKLFAWIYEWSWVPLTSITIIFPALLFPDGRLLPGWRKVAWLGAAAILITTLGVAFRAGTFEEFEVYRNPVGLEGTLSPLPNVMAWAGLALVLTTAALAAISQIIRYRQADTVVRHQIKWFAAAAFVWVLAFAVVTTTFGAIQANATSEDLEGARKWVEASLIFALALIPIAIAIAVLRYRLYDIDILINRTIVYVPLTAILAGLFVATTGLLRTLFTEVTRGGSDAAIAFSTLFIVATLTPLKNQLQSLVDRHFKDDHDAADALVKMSQHASSILDVLDRDVIIRDYLDKMVAALEATGAQVRIDANPDEFYFVGQLNEVAMQLPLIHREIEVGQLLLGPNSRSGAYPQEALSAVETSAAVLARLISIQAFHPELTPPRETLRT